MDLEARIAALEERVTQLEIRAKKRPKVDKPMGAIHEFRVDRKLIEVLKPVSEELQKDWLEIFLSADWIGQELKKAHAWCLANPDRAPKSNWGRFYNSWLLRSWEKYRKQPQRPKDQEFDW